MAAKNPQVWARVEPELRERLRREAALLYDGNESMLIRRAIVRFLADLDEQRRRASEVAVVSMIAEPELAAVAS